MIIHTTTGLMHTCVGPTKDEPAHHSQDYWNGLRNKIVWCLVNPLDEYDRIGVCLHSPEYGMKFRLGPKDNIIPTYERATTSERMTAYQDERKKNAKPTVHR